MIEHEVEGAAVRLVADINNSDASINEYKLPEHWSRSGATVQSLNLPEDCVLIYSDAGFFDYDSARQHGADGGG